MRTPLATIDFNSDLTVDNGIAVRSIGKAKNKMNLHVDQDGRNGYIDWSYTLEYGTEGEQNIGLLFTGKTVTDFDGVFELPEEAVDLLKSAGFDCSQVS